MSVTIKDIARMAGVSYSTVSKALNNSPLVKEKTKNKIIQIAKETGYQPNIAAKSLVSKKTRTIGVLWPTVERVFLSTLVTKINEELEKRSYSMILSINPVESAIELFNRFQVEGILVFEESPHSYKKRIQTSVPLLSYGGIGNSYPSVDVNRRQAIFRAVEFLYQMGHRKIAYIGDLSKLNTNQKEKYIGYTEGIFKFGIQPHPDMTVDTEGLSVQDGYKAAERMLQSSFRPTAIISGSYDLTVGIVRSLKDGGIRIPADISVVSYDNIPQMAELEIPVTAVGVPLEKIAEGTVTSLLELIQCREPACLSSPLEPEIAIRWSCQPPSGWTGKQNGAARSR